MCVYHLNDSQYLSLFHHHYSPGIHIYSISHPSILSPLTSPLSPLSPPHYLLSPPLYLLSSPLPMISSPLPSISSLPSRYPLNPRGLSYNHPIRFQTGSTILKLAAKCQDVAVEVNYPFLVFHDPDDKVVQYKGRGKGIRCMDILYGFIID